MQFQAPPALRANAIRTLLYMLAIPVEFIEYHGISFTFCCYSYSDPCHTRYVAINFPDIP